MVAVLDIHVVSRVLGQMRFSLLLIPHQKSLRDLRLDDLILENLQMATHDQTFSNLNVGQTFMKNGKIIL